MEDPSTPHAADVKPRLAAAVQTSRVLTHLSLCFGLASTFVCIGVNSAIPLLICGGLFLLSYFTWVSLVLFGFMNFSLSAMLWFVLCLGACLGLLMSGQVPLMVLGGLGLLIMLFATVIPVSRHDPSTPEKRAPGWSSLLWVLAAVIVIALVVGLLGEIAPFVALVAGLWVLVGRTTTGDPNAKKRVSTASDRPGSHRTGSTG